MAAHEYLTSPLPSVLDLEDFLGEDRVRIGEGFSSTAYRIGDYAVKLSRPFDNYSEARQRAKLLRTEHSWYEQYLGEYIPDTVIEVVTAGASDEAPRVMSLQPFIAGITVEQALRHPRTDFSPMITFLERCLDMYKACGKMPDIAHMETGYRFAQTPNVVVDRNTFWPTLVDTNRGRIYRVPGLGQLLTLGIVGGAKQALKQLRTYIS